STSTSSSSTASEMSWAGRAYRPTDEPTATVLLGMLSPRSDGGELAVVRGLVGRCAADGLEHDHRSGSDDRAGDQCDEVAEDVVDREQHEDAAVRGPDRDLEGHG